MNDPLLWQLLLQLALIALNAIFACAEIAVISVNGIRLEKLAAEGNKRAKRLVRLTDEPARFLATIQVAITLSGFLGSAFAAENFADRLATQAFDWGVKIPLATLEAISVILITLILSFLTLVLGELVPKRIAMRKAEKVALALSGVIAFVAKLSAPLVWLLTVSTNGLLRMIGIDPNQKDEEVTEEEIRMMVDEGSETGAIDETEKEIIQNVFEFDDLTAGEIATHRTDLEILWTEDPPEIWEQILRESEHSYFPVCGDSADDVKGVLSAKVFFRLLDTTRENVLDKAMSAPYFVPESVKADVLFRNMKRTKNRMAIVMDEYGGMSGIVTINDLVEQLIGEFNIEEEQPNMIAQPDGSWIIRGETPLDDVSKELHVTIPEVEGCETFGGLVFGELGAIPEDGSTFDITLAGMEIHVLEVRDHCMELAQVRVLPPQEEEEPEEK